MPRFTAEITRTLPFAPETVFDAWLSPDIRRQVIGRQVYKNGIKALDPVEGGEEVYEYRWRNRLEHTETRTYLEIDRPRLIRTKVLSVPAPGKSPVKLPQQKPRTSEETLRFEPAEGGTLLHVTVVKNVFPPKLFHPKPDDNATAQWWALDLDVFEAALLAAHG